MRLPPSAIAIATILTGLSISCQAQGAVRGLAVLITAAAGLLAWGAHRSQARAGGGSVGGADSTGSGTGSDADTDTTGAADGSGSEGGSGSAGTTEAATEGTDSSTGASSTSDTSDSDTGTTYVGPCLSIEPEMTVCLCACETDPGHDLDWAPALLLPIVVRRRHRRQSVQRMAAQGRLPRDVVDRLNRSLDGASDPD